MRCIWDKADMLPALKAKQYPISVITGENQDTLQVIPDHVHCNADVTYFIIDAHRCAKYATHKYSAVTSASARSTRKNIQPRNFLPAR